MTMSVAHSAESASPMRGLLPLWVGVGVYVLFLLAGNRLLIDPDTMWQVTVGQWIIDHRAVPETDVYSFTMRGQPWISTQWLAQVLYAKAYAIAGWSGPVVLAASAIAATFALLARLLSRHLTESTTLVFVAAALALTVPHLLARPHVLAMPVMVMWVGGLIAAADRRAAPSFWLLPLMALWANLHGGFVFGLVLIAPVALDAVLGADATARTSLVLRWAAFAIAALAASCCTPYGWNALLASRKILALGSALPLIMEWEPANFGSIGAFEICLLLGHRARAVARHQAAADAHRAAAGAAAHGAGPGARRRNPGAARAAGSGRPAGASRSAAPRTLVRKCVRRRAACCSPASRSR